MRRPLALGLSLLELFIAEQGDGHVGPEGRRCRYISIFDALLIPRVV